MNPAVLRPMVGVAFRVIASMAQRLLAGERPVPKRQSHKVPEIFSERPRDLWEEMPEVTPHVEHLPDHKESVGGPPELDL